MKDRIETICARIFVETVKFLAAFIALMAVVLVGLVIYKLSSPKLNVEDYEVVDYMVLAGDTPDAICGRYKSEDDCIECWEEAVRELNGGYVNMTAGSHIYIYVAK